MEKLNTKPYIWTKFVFRQKIRGKIAQLFNKNTFYLRIMYVIIFITIGIGILKTHHEVN